MEYLGRRNAANFGICGKRVDSTKEYIKIVLILSNIPPTEQVGSSWLGIDGSKLLSEKGPSAASRIERDSSTAIATFRADFGNRNLFRQYIATKETRWREGLQEKDTRISVSSPAVLAETTHQHATYTPKPDK